MEHSSLHSPATIARSRAMQMLPQPAIGIEIATATQELYGMRWSPRVVRQTRQINAGSLQYVDYAVPCFELGKLLKQDVQIVAQEIVAGLKERQIFVDETNIIYGAQIEAVGGYINFCISDRSIKRAIKTAVHWYKEPYLGMRQRPMDEFLILGTSIGGNNTNEINSHAYKFIDEVYSLIGKKHEATQLMSDYSESTIQCMTSELIKRAYEEKELTVFDKMKIQKDVRNFFTKGTPNEKVSEQWALCRSNARLIDARHAPGLIWESDLVNDVHTQFNELSVKTAAKKGIVKDASSQALYYEGANDTVPLRSTGGLLYSPAYLLLTLQTVVQRIKNSQSKTLVVLAPQKLHYLVHTYVRLSVKSKTMPERVICFDPKTSMADITALTRNFGSLETHFKTLAATLLNGQENMHVSRQRQAILSLVDLPVELSFAVGSVQLPLMFDMLHQTSEALAVLKS
ncbi:hypothetical protein BH09PAT3_BH09PAT3_2430 [soil metagenome]